MFKDSLLVFATKQFANNNKLVFFYFFYKVSVLKPKQMVNKDILYPSCGFWVKHKFLKTVSVREHFYFKIEIFHSKSCLVF